MPSLALLALVAVVAVTACAAGWAMLLRPQRGLLALAGLVPFNGLLQLVNVPGIVQGWKEALTLMTVAAALVCPARSRPGGERTLPSWIVPLGAFAGLSLLWLVLLHTPQALLGVKINLFYVSVVFVVWRCPFDARDRDHLVTILMGTGFVTALYGVVQQLLGGERLHAMGYPWNGTIRTASEQLRSFSTFDQPFPFAFFVMTVLLVAGPVALADRKRFRNRVFLWASPMLVIGLASAIVRGAILGLAVGGAFLVFARFRFLLHVLAPVVLLALFLPGGLLSAMTSSSSLGQRTGGWSTVGNQMLAAPFGVGVGATGGAAEKAAPTNPEDIAHGVVGETGPTFGLPVEELPYQPDNYYVKTILELGVPGLWVILALLVTSFRAARRSASQASGDDRSLALGIAASVLAAASASLVASYWEIFPLDVFFWLFLGVITSIDLALDEPNRWSRSNRPTQQLAVVV